MRLVFDPVKQAACGFPGPPPVPGDPLGRHSLIVNPALDEGAPSDLDRDGELTHLEFVHFLISQLALAGLDQMEVEARSCFNTALEGLPESGKTLCASDPPGESARRRAAEHNLKRALDYAQALQLVLQPYIDALDFCRVEVAVEPTSAVLQPGAQRQFAATVTGVLDEDGNGGVNWSATGGSITQGGLYTAPSAPGTYEVKATSAINSARSATAQVTVTPPGTVTVTVDDGSASGSAHVECAGLPGADDFDSDESTELSHTLTYHASVATTCNQDSHKADAQGTHTAAASASSITASASGGGSVESTASRRVSVGAGGNLRAIVDVDSGTLPYTVSGTVTSTSGGSRSLSAFGHRAGADGTLNVSGTLGPGRHEVSIGASCIRVLVSAGTDDCSYSYSLNVSLG